MGEEDPAPKNLGRKKGRRHCTGERYHPGGQREEDTALESSGTKEDPVRRTGVPRTRKGEGRKGRGGEEEEEEKTLLWRAVAPRKSRFGEPGYPGQGRERKGEVREWGE